MEKKIKCKYCGRKIVKRYAKGNEIAFDVEDERYDLHTCIMMEDFT